MLLRAAVLALVAACATCGWSATYHVSKADGASDNNDGTAQAPWSTISRAAKQAKAGDTVLIHQGTYREWAIPQASGTAQAPIVFSGVDRDHVILTGADVIEGWQRTQGERPIYDHRPWKARFQVTRTKDGQPIYHHPANDRHRLIGRAEQVIVDGQLLDQVLTLDEMKAGTFCADLEQQVLHVWLADGADPGERLVEACTRGWVFGYHPWAKKGKADHIHLSNVTIRYAANHAQRGALWVGGDGWHIEHVTVEWTNGNGVSVRGRGLYINDLVSRHNGQMGMGGSPQGGYLADIKLLDNNRKGYNAGWEAGGMKFTHARDTVLCRVQAARNGGPGIWFDIGNRDCVIRQCVCHHNDGHGIFIEISGAFIVTNNLCYSNGQEPHWSAAGICVGESEDCIVEHNTCVANPTGISVREQGPRKLGGRFGPLAYWVRNFICQYNICAFNTEYQFGLWADNVFFGPHPSAGVGAKGTPLDPAKNNYRIDHNLYCADEGQGLVLWGCPWRNKHTVYPDLPSFTEQHGQDAATVVADPLFVDREADDYRLSEDSSAVAAGAGAIFLRPAH